MTDAFGNDQPDHDSPADHKRKQEKNQTQTGVGFIHFQDLA